MEYHNRFPKMKDDPDRVRLGLIPSIPDLMSYLVAFLILWSIYTLVSRGLASVEISKAAGERTIAEERAEQKKALTELAHTATGGLFKKDGPIEDSALQSIWTQVREVIDPYIKKRPKKENRF